MIWLDVAMNEQMKARWIFEASKLGIVRCEYYLLLANMPMMRILAVASIYSFSLCSSLLLDDPKFLLCLIVLLFVYTKSHVGSDSD
jgi:hypothetical protein